jgi:hypothetical protein
VPSRSPRCCAFERVLMVPPVDCGSSPASSPSSWHVPVPGRSGGGASLRCRGIRAGEGGRRLPLGPHLTFRRPQYPSQFTTTLHDSCVTTKTPETSENTLDRHDLIAGGRTSKAPSFPKRPRPGTAARRPEHLDARSRLGHRRRDRCRRQSLGVKRLDTCFRQTADNVRYVALCVGRCAVRQ